MIGLTMAVNLLAAHLFRFKVQAKGRMLLVGTLLLLIGGVFVYLVVSGGSLDQQNQSGQQANWGSVWLFFKMMLLALTLTGLGSIAYYAKQGHYRSALFWILSVPVLLSAAIVFWVLLSGKEAYLGDAGMRILWQLMLAEGASLVCLAGCLIVFKRRGGVVLLHAGLALIMFGELMVDLYAVESRVTLAEGETATYAADSRFSELAIIDRSGKKTDDEVVVPESMLRNEQNIQHPFLPFDIVPVRFFCQYADEPEARLAGSSRRDVAYGERSGSGFRKPCQSLARDAFMPRGKLPRPVEPMRSRQRTFRPPMWNLKVKTRRTHWERFS